MLNIGGGELLIILLVALIFLGPERLPSVARQAGQMMSSLRSLASGFQEELNAAAKPDVDPADSMKLAGPTDQQAAVVATQTDPAAIAAAARAVTHDDDEDGDLAEPAKSAGGPVDLTDEEE